MPEVEQLAAIDPDDIADELLAGQVADTLFCRSDEHLARRRKEGDVDHMGENMIAKLYDTGLKALRQKTELREKRRLIEHDNKLLLHDRELAGIRRAH